MADFPSMKHPLEQAAPQKKQRGLLARFLIKTLKVVGLTLLGIVVAVAVAYALLSRGERADVVAYGMSFDPSYVDELHLDWKEVFEAIIDDGPDGLGAKRLRIGVRWPSIEPERGRFDFSRTDYMLDRAREEGIDVILVVGRRNLRWPECHVPDWAQSLDKDSGRSAVTGMVKTVIERYRDNSAISMWQIENEPYLEIFSQHACGELDEELLAAEIGLTKKLDPSRPILVTDSGNLGTWYGPWKSGDAFGTSIYQYLWNPELGPIKSIVPASFYRMKRNLMSLLLGDKPSYLIELSAEPWLVTPIVEASLETQFERMDTDKFAEILEFAKDTGFDKQYLWGAEWWYWLKQKGYPDFWQMGQGIFDK